MAVRATTDASEVRAVVDAALRTDPVRLTALSSVLAGLDVPDAAPWAAFGAAPLPLAARSQPSTPVVVTPGWSDGAELAAAIAAVDPPPASLSGPVRLVEQLAARLGRPVGRRMQDRLFRLDELVEPAPVAGSARLAHSEDLDLLAPWLADFQREAFGRERSTDDVRPLVTRMLGRSRVWLWCAPEGPVSLAARHPNRHGASRIGPVYTPPEHRGRGYGSAVTAAATRDILADGAVPCLFTDLANPTSNKIYQALGYRPVVDHVEVTLG